MLPWHDIANSLYQCFSKWAIWLLKEEFEISREGKLLGKELGAFENLGTMEVEPKKIGTSSVIIAYSRNSLEKQGEKGDHYFLEMKIEKYETNSNLNVNF